MGVLCYCCCCCYFKNLKSKTLEILALAFQGISFVLLFCSLIIIRWSKISIANFLLFILMLIITLFIIILSSFIRFWRAKNIIKTSKKMRAQNFALTCIILIIICFIICAIEEFVIFYSFSKADYPCQRVNFGNPEKSSYFNYYYYDKRNLDSDIDCYQVGRNHYAHIITDAEYYVSYITFTYLEFSFILGIWIMYILRRRIIQGIDGPSTTPLSPILYDQYGRKVVVVQQGDVVIMDGQPHIAVSEKKQNNNQSSNQINQSNNQFNHFNNNQYRFNNNSGSSQNISNQINNNLIPDSQEYSLPVKPN